MSLLEQSFKNDAIEDNLKHDDNAGSDSDEEVEFDSKRFRSNSHVRLDGEDRVGKCRERNREHAKKTRLRKKAMLETLKAKLLELQSEASKLQQALEESNTASILLCLGDKVDEPNGNASSAMVPDYSVPEVNSELSKGNIIDQLRSIVRAEAAIFLKPKFESTFLHTSAMAASSATCVISHEESAHDSDDEDDHEITPPSSSSVPSKAWKDGHVVSDKAGNDDLEIIRKERNRMHAKLTRDRKKMFTSRLQQMINALERQNQGMRTRLQMQVQSHSISQQPSNPSTAQPQPMPQLSPSYAYPVYLPNQSASNMNPLSAAIPMFVYPAYAHPSLLQSMGLPPNFNFNQAMAMAPPMNVNAYGPLSLKRKASES